MDFTVLIVKAGNVQVDEDAVKKVESVYKKSFSNDLKKIISLSKEPIFAGDWRTLSLDEICNANDCLGIDCTGKGILPLIDIMDNNFVFFDLYVKSWKLMNIVDEIEYSEASTIEGLFDN